MMDGWAVAARINARLIADPERMEFQGAAVVTHIHGGGVHFIRAWGRKEAIADAAAAEGARLGVDGKIWL